MGGPRARGRVIFGLEYRGPALTGVQRSLQREPRIPAWVRPLSGLIIALQRLGVAFFSFYVLSIPGRRSGRIRRTVVSPFTVGGEMYVLSFGQLDWVRNARAAGWALLRRGRQEARVLLEEVPPAHGRSVVGEFPKQIPAGVEFFVQLGLVDSPGRPDQFEASADRLVLFRVHRST